ncbi:hypothetical protein PLICRDRAFT_180680 [Plicaturopsis crispa FD-325 SS-3]|uniref:Unplaced genomic scaffold PLICRscaffold_29, whole genome shotgun sequence n=1 Tax=Plicaturopsis crispa FD-325 SS-3 TaxID=944288 RepID=A0A0C9SK50_PLICR|nr:hypothetical protein PLICRDRAFT_180680 [Plicaturopsis crispa FD-325 SS-3]
MSLEAVMKGPLSNASGIKSPRTRKNCSLGSASVAASTTVSVRPRKKKARTAGTPVSDDAVSAGPTLCLAAMSLDIIHEIVEFLHPKDILALTRTCKGLAHWLTNQMYDAIWRRALNRTYDGIPHPSHDLTWYQYTRLVEIYVCHFCGRRMFAKCGIMWALGVRCCKECRATRPDKVVADPQAFAFHFGVRSILGSVDPTWVLNVHKERRLPPQSNVLYSKADEIRGVLQHLEDLALKDHVALKAFVQSRAASVRDTAAFARLADTWTMHHRYESDKLETARRTASRDWVMQRLAKPKSEWTLEVEYLETRPYSRMAYEFLRHPVMYSPHCMDESRWLTVQDRVHKALRCLRTNLEQNKESLNLLAD